MTVQKPKHSIPSLSIHADPSEDYYLLSDVLAEDKELRIKLKRKRLVRPNEVIVHELPE